MEIISNAANSAASAASRAIWGDANTKATQASESGIEPLSGQTGDVAKGEPYDAGNADIKNAHIANPSTPDISSSTREGWAPNNTTGALAGTSAAGNIPGTDPIRPEHDQDKTGVTYLHQPASGSSDSKPSNPIQGFVFGTEPPRDADSANGDRITQKQQELGRPTESPKGDEVKAIRESKEDAEAEQSAETGEKYVKTSGTKAAGGNFDAAQAGAGKEADRILETKGIQSESPVQSSHQNSGKNIDDASQKKHGIRAKIKGILHKS